MEGLFLPLLLMLIVAIPLIMGSRKQKRMAQQQQELQSSLTEGDRVMTTSGLYATVADASDETTIDLEIADGVVTTWLRQAVREKIVLDEDGGDTDGAEATDEVETAPADTTPDTAEKVEAEVAPPLEHKKK
ncbi:preprotein translocase subunit YajC [Amycolatopsis arida]|uniref:Preprotein translocase subunit YajC n=1 Tax=Amycolatopsis arida TaxID=587909 RepID=A0A1I5Z5E0_9PSEU|nr:preprotein translocase subunit YajC [Amycolatopsis arida]TDX90157.1 preprotein translocase subunit YajC [Amycolatopsis arida]SFQ51696.1 preprotein translocase subunit YajC [Amycolatopsis arida]